MKGDRRIEYKAELTYRGWVVRRTGRRGGNTTVARYPETTEGRMAATSVASRLDQYSKLET